MPSDPAASEIRSRQSWWRAWRGDILCALGFLTRIPLSRAGGVADASLGTAFRALPLLGAAIGLVGGAVFWIGSTAGLPALVVALLTLAALALLTGALHEDGLADCADALGAGRDRTLALAIMRDSRIGSFGVLALIFVVGVKASALAALTPLHAVAALVATHAGARGLLALLAWRFIPARADGLGASLGRVEQAIVVQSLLLGLLLPILAAGAAALLALAAGAIAVLIVRHQAQRRIGGHTGDVFGAAEQLAEAAMLLAFAAW